MLYCTWKICHFWDWSNAGINHMFWKSLLERFIILTSGYFKSRRSLWKQPRDPFVFQTVESLCYFCQPWLSKWLWVKVIQLWSVGVLSAPWNTDFKKQPLWTWSAHCSQGLRSLTQFLSGTKFTIIEHHKPRINRNQCSGYMSSHSQHGWSKRKRSVKLSCLALYLCFPSI